MALYDKTGKALLIDLVTQSNQLPVALTATNCEFYNLRTQAGQPNSRIECWGHFSKGFRGRVDLEYQRLDLGKLFQGLQIRPGKYNPTRVSDFFADLQRKTGLPFNTTEIVDSAFNAQTATKLVLTAQVKSTFYVGSVELDFEILLPTLEEIWPTAELTHHHCRQAAYDNRLSTDATYKSKPRFWPGALTIGNDYSAVGSILKNIPAYANWTDSTPANSLAIANALKSVDGIPWRSTGGGPNYDYDLYIVYCSYNGPVANLAANLKTAWGIDSNRTANVMVLNPPFQQQKNMWYGPMIVYYNP